MLDGRSKLHTILRKVYSVEQIIRKGELFYSYCRDYSFDIIDTKNYLIKKKIIKEVKKKKVNKVAIEGTVWDNPIIIVDWDDLTPEQQEDFMHNTTSPMTTLPIETN
jgi:hydrogenase maturation factor HypF (carbamoyltransferase family)